MLGWFAVISTGCFIHLHLDHNWNFQDWRCVDVSVKSLQAEDITHKTYGSWILADWLVCEVFLLEADFKDIKNFLWGYLQIFVVNMRIYGSKQQLWLKGFVIQFVWVWRCTDVQHVFVCLQYCNIFCMLCVRVCRYKSVFCLQIDKENLIASPSHL
jgi:hypothetical protein